MPFRNTESRLIVAVDWECPEDLPEDTTLEELALAFLEPICEELGPLCVTIKLNTVLRIIGSWAFEVVEDAGLECFADLKLFDIGNTLKNEGAWLRHASPMILTVSARVKPTAFQELQAMLPDTLLLPVDPLTDLTDKDFLSFGNPREANRKDATRGFFQRAEALGAMGLICAPVDIELMGPAFREKIAIVTPGIQTLGMGKNDNSENALTPTRAIEAGADALVVGRAIMDAPNRREAAERILEEMEAALAKRT